MMVFFSSKEAAHSGEAPQLRPAFVRDGQAVSVDFLGHGGGVRLHGRFLDRSGEPLREQKFSIFDTSSADISDFLASASDATGAYQVQLDGPGTYRVYLTVGMGDALVLADELEVPAAASFEHDVVAPAFTLSGTVVDAADDEPLPRSVVLLMRYEPAGGLGFGGKALTDAQGRYAFDGVLPGDYGVFALATDGLYAAERSARISVGEGAPEPHDVTVALRAGGSVALHVVDPDGRPVEQAEVRLELEDGESLWFGEQQATDAEGRIEVAGLAPHTYTLIVRKEGYERETITLLGRVGSVVQRTVVLTPSARED